MRFDPPKQLTFPAFPAIPLDRPPKNKGERAARATAFKANLRRQAQLKRAAEVLPILPRPGESVHTLLTGYFDYAVLLSAVIQSDPRACARMRIATLGFSTRNVAELCKLLDSGKVLRLDLLCSNYMAKAAAKVYHGAYGELVTARGQRLANARSHCKVVCLEWDDGASLVFEGSANLRTNRNLEQLTVFNDGALHDWHAAWIDRGVADGTEKEKAGRQAQREAEAPLPD